jgi:hypothetical protein
MKMVQRRKKPHYRNALPLQIHHNVMPYIHVRRNLQATMGANMFKGTKMMLDSAKNYLKIYIFFVLTFESYVNHSKTKMSFEKI